MNGQLFAPVPTDDRQAIAAAIASGQCISSIGRQLDGVILTVTVGGPYCTYQGGNIAVADVKSRGACAARGDERERGC